MRNWEFLAIRADGRRYARIVLARNRDDAMKQARECCERNGWGTLTAITKLYPLHGSD